MSVDQRIVVATEQLEADVSLTHDIVHGGESTEVQTEGGPVPSHAKVAVDSNKEIIGLLQPTVTSINDHAEFVTSEAGRATDQTNQAVSAKNEAVAARNQAKAIVYEGEFSETPAPGSVAIADENGHLDSGWTPLLQAMYPYSGVIGSTDNVLYFGGSSSDYVNKFHIPLYGRNFNINGRFVHVNNQAVSLPEAESTVARAVAFDDIFIDWNGNIVTHRSITPYRTETGFECDAIATEHGYTKVQNGLYRTSDSQTYLLLLGRVTRRNKGAYHYQWNPQGAAGIRKHTGEKYYFYEVPDEGRFTSPAECFTFPPENYKTDYKVWGGSINFNGDVPAVVSGRPDGRQYDAIHVEDFTPLYFSANNIIDRQELLFDSINRAVAGETFSGAEGTNTLVQALVNMPFSPSSNFYIDTGVFQQRPIDESISGSRYWRILNLTKEFEYSLQRDVYITKHGLVDVGCTPEQSAATTTGDRLEVFLPVRDKHQASVKSQTMPSASPEFLTVDIIGDTSAMPAEWLRNGIPGKWLAMDEDGNSLIPDGASKNFKLSRKCLECYLVIFTNDNGALWQTHSNAKNAFEGASNSWQNPTASNTAMMVFYRTSANPFELANHTDTHAQVLCLNGTAVKLSWHEYRAGGLITSNLSNKVATNADNYANEIKAMNSFKFDFRSSGFHVSTNTAFGNHSHLPFNTATPVNNSPSVKINSYIPFNSQFVYLQIIYKEMKHNGTSWGDDNQFNIVDNQSTVTDLNGKTVIVGQKRVELPYHFDSITY